MTEHEVIAWRRIEPPYPVNGDLHQLLATVDALKKAWVDAVSDATEDEFREARERSLRRHAIETGIIERLYDVQWGVTEALVAEGLSAEVAAREGGIDEDALATIRTQFDALTFLSESARQGRPLTISFIRELHVALCRNQTTYQARTQFGQVVQRPLRHGDWKEQANHVSRPDGRLLEYTPPEHVASELDLLLKFNDEAKEIHPLVRTAWLHHGFVTIHPFEDGNGRVARALTLLLLLQLDFAPLVVDRFSRTDYLDALDSANNGELRELVRLFARLETVALRSELERPARPRTAGAGAIDVARSYVQRLQAVRQSQDAERGAKASLLAADLNARNANYLRELGQGLVEQFKPLDHTATSYVFTGDPPDEKAHWWRAQIVRAAKYADFFVNLTEGTWWANLRLILLGQQLRFGTVTQKVGQGETGVLAVTVFAEAVPSRRNEEDSVRPQFTVLLRPTEAESATVVYTDTIEDRWPEICGLIDRTLAAAVAHFAEGLS